MKSPYHFIVTPKGGDRYNHTNKEGIIVSVSKEDASHSNRIAIVVETPVGYDGPIKNGYELIVHHNVFKFYNDMKGRERSGRSFLFGDRFFVENDRWFMYREPGGEWKTHDKYCFVAPEKLEQDFWMTIPGLEFHLTGRLAYSNQELEQLGVHQGNLVGFTPGSEYEFEIDGKRMYRMFTENICLTIHE